MRDAATFTPGAGSVYAPVSVTATPTRIPDATELPYEYVEAATQTPGDNGSAVATVDPNAFVPNTSAPDADNAPMAQHPDRYVSVSSAWEGDGIPPCIPPMVDAVLSYQLQLWR